ncbi:MAG: MerR family transcriptional regulator [Candidatus Ancaeobacter aquaticus]|nr:MerR family transcriptional regulator [Candidatus Ancaeobacter aquaticus]
MKPMKAMKTDKSFYKIADLAREVDRSCRTVKEWEKKGLIPKASRDSRGWRVYTEKQLKKVVKLVKERNYFLTLL